MALTVLRQVCFVKKAGLPLLIECLSTNACLHKTHQCTIHCSPINVFYKLIGELSEGKSPGVTHQKKQDINAVAGGFALMLA